MSSLSHGGETLGTVTYLRREVFLTRTGRVDVPVVSGNAVRGVLRETGARLLWEALGEPKLPLGVVHALWSGGALTKSRTQPLTGQRLAEVRTVLPHIGVFGVAGGGRIVDGALQVGKLVPVCAQTEDVLPVWLRDRDGGAGLPDMYDLLQIERYSRIPDQRMTELVAETPEPGASGADDNLLMRYGIETFVPGTRFYSMFTLTNATDLEYEFFNDVLSDWLPVARVGGNARIGHGNLAFDLTTPEPPTTVTTEPSEATVGWRAFQGKTLTETREILSCLN